MANNFSEEEEFEFAAAHEKELAQAPKAADVPAPRKYLADILGGLRPPVTPKELMSPKLTDPLTYLSPLPGTMMGKNFEEAGATGKQDFQKLVSNFLDKQSNMNPYVKGIGTGLASLLMNVLPTTPSEAALTYGGESVTKSLLEAIPSIIGKMPEHIANRFYKQPLPEAMDRLRKSQVPLGEEVLSNPKLKDFRKNDKRQIYYWAEKNIKSLGEKVDSEIDKVFQKGKTPNVPKVEVKGTPQLEYKPSGVQEVKPGEPSTGSPTIRPDEPIPLSQGGYGERIEPKVEVPPQRGNLGEATRGLKEPTRYPMGTPGAQAIETKNLEKPVDDLLEQLKESGGGNDPEYLQVKKFKENFFGEKPEALDFKRANKLRKYLGERLGRKFSQPNANLTEADYARKLLFGKLRNEVGKVSPEVSKMLSQQHLLYEIQNSVGPEAARGFEDAPSGWKEWVASKLTGARSMEQAATLKGIRDIDYSKMLREVPGAGAIGVRGIRKYAVGDDGTYTPQ